MVHPFKLDEHLAWKSVVNFQILTDRGADTRCIRSLWVQQAASAPWMVRFCCFPGESRCVWWERRQGNQSGRWADTGDNYEQRSLQTPSITAGRGGHRSQSTWKNRNPSLDLFKHLDKDWLPPIWSFKSISLDLFWCALYLTDSKNLFSALCDALVYSR